MPGPTNSVTPADNVERFDARSEPEPQSLASFGLERDRTYAKTAQRDDQPGSFEEPSGEATTSRTILEQPVDTVKPKTSTGEVQLLHSEIKYQIPVTRQRSKHFGQIYKVLLGLAIAVALTGLVSQARNDSGQSFGTEPATEQIVDSGSPDAPPPDVLLQGD